MKDQHTLIKGYRDLSQQEIDLINKIKVCEALTLELIADIDGYLYLQSADAATGSQQEIKRLEKAAPKRWLSIAKTDIETGFMALVRSVAQPAPSRIDRSQEGGTNA
jgi:tryptophan synthase alpha subunit